MNYRITNFGPIKDATIEIKPLTVICGANNTGKSYITYSLFTLLDFLKSASYNVFNAEKSREFLQTGHCVINLFKIIEIYKEFRHSQDRQNRFKEVLPAKMLLESNACAGSSFEFSLSDDDERFLSGVIRSRSFNIPVKLNSEYQVRFLKREGQTSLGCVIEPAPASDLDNLETMSEQKPFLPADGSILKQVIPFTDVVMRSFALDVFMITSERTGVVTFRPELSLLRDFVYNASPDKAKSFSNLRKQSGFKGYSFPIEKELAFVFRLSTFLKSDSKEQGATGDIVSFFEDIASGAYVSDENSGNSICYSPQGSGIKLTMSASSSSVRTLSELYFYLKYKANFGQTLMVDEPELNLHPAAQRKMARLFCRLVNSGIKVFVTTHSDYLIREINALTSMSTLPSSIRDNFLQKHGYDNSDLLPIDKVSCYVLRNGKSDRIKPDAQYGFAVDSFDDTIRQFNSLYSDLQDAIEELSNVNS